MLQEKESGLESYANWKAPEGTEEEQEPERTKEEQEEEKREFEIQALNKKPEDFSDSELARARGLVSWKRADPYNELKNRLGINRTEDLNYTETGEYYKSFPSARGGVERPGETVVLDEESKKLAAEMAGLDKRLKDLNNELNRRMKLGR